MSRSSVVPGSDIPRQTGVLAEQTIDWFQANSLKILIAVGMAALIVAFLLAVQKGVQRLTGGGDGRTDWRGIIARAARRTHFLFLVVVAARLVDGYAGAPVLVDRTIAFLFTVGFTFQAAAWAREILIGFIEYRAATSDRQHGAALASAIGIIRFLASFAIFSIALILVLSNLGVNVAGLVAGLGIGGIAIGLAAQGIFADLFAGLAILFDRPFRVGDQIAYGDSGGTVVAIGMKSTRLRADTGELRIISNKNLLDKEIQNVTGRDHTRISFPLGVVYETPPETLARLPALLKQLVDEPGVTVARAGFDSFGASSLNFLLQFDVPGNDGAAANAVRDRVLVSVVRGLSAAGVVLAYPTQTTYTAGSDGRPVMPDPSAASGDARHVSGLA